MEFSLQDLLEIKEMASNVRGAASDSSSGPSEGEEPDCPLNQTIAIPNQGGSPTPKPNPRADFIEETRRQFSESFTSGEDHAEQMEKLNKLTGFIMRAYEKKRDMVLMCDADETAYFRNIVPVELSLQGMHTYMAFYRKNKRKHGAPKGVRGRNWDLDIKCNYLYEVANHKWVEWFRIAKDSGRIHIKLDFNNIEVPTRPKSIRVWISAVPLICRGVTIWGSAHCWEAGIDEGTNFGATMDFQEDWEWRMASGPSGPAPPSEPSGHNVDTWLPVGIAFGNEIGWDSIPSSSSQRPGVSYGNTTILSHTTAGEDTQDTFPTSDLPLVSQLSQQASSQSGPSFASFSGGQPLQHPLESWISGEVDHH